MILNLIQMVGRVDFIILLHHIRYTSNKYLIQTLAKLMCRKKFHVL